MTERRALTIRLATPRGFCAGVDRAIQIVEEALGKWGAPVYVRHEIVHNAHVVSRLEAMGAVFVEELEDCPEDRPVIFSAHGVPKSVPAEAQRRQMIYVDATCPLVSKVHVEAERHDREGREIVLINNLFHLRITSLPYASPVRSLTARQREALEWVGDGKTIQDIAILMGLTTATVEKHLRLARESLAVETTAQAVLKASFQNQIFVDRQ